MPRSGLLIAGLGALISCISKPARPPVPESQVQVRTPAPAVSIPTFQDSVCRGYTIPDGLLPTRCIVGGPYPGMLQGVKLGPPGDLAGAVESCLTEADCTGITADWYIDADFTAIRSSGPFVPSDDAYGCTFLIACGDE